MEIPYDLESLLPILGHGRRGPRAVLVSQHTHTHSINLRSARAALSCMFKLIYAQMRQSRYRLELMTKHLPDLTIE